MKKLQDEIAAWADTIIPDRTVDGAVNKLILQEVPELLVALHTTGLIDPGEIADVFILGLDICALSGIDAEQAIRDKMDINRAREWIVNDVGMMSHVQDNSD